MGVPCGTASRARKKMIPKQILAQGAADPQPLRSETHPWGLPQVEPSSKDAQRLHLANQLYKLVLQVVHLCNAKGVLWSIENPKRSLLWWNTEFAALQQEASLFTCDFHMCMHGGTRDTQTKLVAQFPHIMQLCAKCDKSHPHAPWGAKLQGQIFLGGQCWVCKLGKGWTSKSALDLQGRCLDLVKAFKQLNVSPHHGHIAISAVWNPERECPEYFELVACLFGARNVVLTFNWLVRGLHHTLLTEFRIPVTNYYDDFPHIEPFHSPQHSPGGRRTVGINRLPRAD